MILKYAVDTAVIGLVTGLAWTPLDYLIPLLSFREAKVSVFPFWLSASLVVWTLPFLWIGVSMTLRRAIDAGRSPWTVLWFFVPVVNYLVMLWLSTLPSVGVRTDVNRIAVASATDRFRSALIGILVSVSIGMGAISFSVFVLAGYGVSLFIVVPFTLGFAASFAHIFKHRRTYGESIGVALMGLLLTGCALVLFAVEGLVCIAMVIPMAVPLVVIGAVVGHEVALRSVAGNAAAAGVLLLFVGGWTVDESVKAQTRHITSTIVVEAAPEEVWQRVIQFEDIEESPEWFFRLGIAYPVRARIEGFGVGAIRHCEFSTGAFVEPITVWDAPHHLAFDVVDQPPALREMSPYSDIRPPHIDDFFSSVAGEFRLTETEDGRTILEGTTWYQLQIYPHAYWRPISEWLVSRIHLRVLRHIARNS